MKTANHPQIVEGEWLFFSPRDHRRSHYRRYRKNGNGEWKLKHKLTLRDEVGEIGVKNSFYYREGLPPAPTTNTSWQMAKYLLNGTRTQSPNRFVLSIIYRNTQRGPSNNAVVDCSGGASQTSSQLRIGETENLAQPPPSGSQSEGGMNLNQVGFQHQGGNITPAPDWEEKMNGNRLQIDETENRQHFNLLVRHLNPPVFHINAGFGLGGGNDGIGRDLQRGETEYHQQIPAQRPPWVFESEGVGYQAGFHINVDSGLGG